MITTTLDSSGRRGSQEPMMGLQHPCADHRQAVQPHLRREHDDKCSQGVGAARTVRLGEHGGEHRAPTSTASPAGVSTSKVQVISADAVRDAAPRGPPDMPSDHRNHDASEDAAGHDLEEHIRQAVGRVVGVAEAGVPDGLGEDQ